MGIDSPKYTRYTEGVVHERKMERILDFDLDDLAKARKPRKRRRRKPRQATAPCCSSSSTRATSGSTRANRTEEVKRPEWYWLFTTEEWQRLNPVDREQVKKIIVGFTPWGDAYDLTKLFLPLDWWSEHSSTRLRLLFQIPLDRLSEVDRAKTRDGQEVYFLASHRECQKIPVFPGETMIRTIVPRDSLIFLISTEEKI